MRRLRREASEESIRRWGEESEWNEGSEDEEDGSASAVDDSSSPPDSSEDSMPAKRARPTSGGVVTRSRSSQGTRSLAVPPRVSRRPQETVEYKWSFLLRRLAKWSELNTAYSAKLDSYDYAKGADRTPIQLEYDLLITSPGTMVRDVFREIFQTSKTVGINDMTTQLVQIAECADDPLAPRVIIVLYNWIEILSDSKVVACIERMVKPLNSIFLFVLRGDLVTRLVHDRFRVRPDRCGSVEWETIFLLPSPWGLDALEDIVNHSWYAQYFLDLIAEDRLRFQTLTHSENPSELSSESPVPSDAGQTPKSPTLLNARSQEDIVDELIPRFASGYMFANQLRSLRGIRNIKANNFRTFSAPMKTLHEIRMLAY